MKDIQKIKDLRDEAWGLAYDLEINSSKEEKEILSDLSNDINKSIVRINDYKKIEKSPLAKVSFKESTI